MDSAQTKLTNARMAVSLLGAAEEGTELLILHDIHSKQSAEPLVTGCFRDRRILQCVLRRYSPDTLAR